ncbi:hypothetical protein [Bacillus sp. EAC]|uniref:hypothetical protein n=1 Tax=Bacillus sp. EAC TaxID=1978338 RepID=UPI000B42DF40|nr:hypothetical protein [Bacillus sp. EAC]
MVLERDKIDNILFVITCVAGALIFFFTKSLVYCLIPLAIYATIFYSRRKRRQKNHTDEV